MATILEPTSAEAMAAGYLHDRERCLDAIEILSEAIDRLHDVVTGKEGASKDEIAYIINRAQGVAKETLLLYGSGK